MRTSSGSDDEYESDTSSQDNDESEVSEVDADEHSVDGEGTEDEPTSCQNCSSANLCHILVVKCPKCKWQDGYISTQDKLDCEISQDRFSLKKKTLRELLQLCNECGFLSHTSVRSGDKQYFEVDSDNEID